MKRYGLISVLLSGLMLSGSLPAADQAKDPAKPSAGSATNAPAEPRLFQFGGGDFNQFRTKLRDEFGKDTHELIEIRGADPNRIYVPKMRIRGVSDIREVFMTYNRISQEGDGFLGKWIFSPSQLYSAGIRTYPDTIIFLTPKGGGTEGSGGIQVRAFPIRFLSQDRLKALNEVIEKESRKLQREIAERSGDPSSGEGRVTVHEGAYLLVASGGKMYVELVATLVEAFMTSLEKTGPQQR